MRRHLINLLAAIVALAATMMLTARAAQPRATRTSDTHVVAKHIDLSGVTVTSTASEGFWIRTPSGEPVFVLTTQKTRVKEGQRADVKGIVLELRPTYLFADTVTPRG